MLQFPSLLVIVECGLLACWTEFLVDTWLLITEWLAGEMELVKEKKPRNGDKTKLQNIAYFLELRMTVCNTAVVSIIFIIVS